MTFIGIREEQGKARDFQELMLIIIYQRTTGLMALEGLACSEPKPSKSLAKIQTQGIFLTEQTEELSFPGLFAAAMDGTAFAVSGISRSHEINGKQWEVFVFSLAQGCPSDPFWLLFRSICENRIGTATLV